MKLDEDSFLLYAAKYYDIRMASSADEFYDDLKRFQHLKRLFKRYDDDDDLKVRLILNHLTVLYNCFGSAATTMLFYKLFFHCNLVRFSTPVAVLDLVHSSGPKLQSFFCPLI